MEKKQKKKVVVIGVLLFIGLVILLAIVYSKATNRKEASGAEVTRYEWIKMLCEKNGITQYKSQTAYFRDVKEDSQYFSYIQSAVEWGILEKENNFKGESSINGRDIALTAMKTIGQSKIQVYLGENKKITDDTYIDLAIENELIEKKQLKKKFKKEECEEILRTLEFLYFNEFWKDNYSNVEYKEHVIQLFSTDILEHNEDYSEVKIKKAIGELEEKTVIVLEEKNSELKVAREIERIKADGTLILIPVDLDDVVEHLSVSDINELTLDSIVKYYELEKTNSSVSNLRCYSMDGVIDKKTDFSLGENSKGFILSVSTIGDGVKKRLFVEATDKNTGLSYALPINVTIETDSEYEAIIDVNKICIGGQVNYSALNNSIEYADVAVDAQATLSGMINANEEKKILLCETAVPLGNGIVGVDIQIYLVLSVDGGISFEAQMPMQAVLSYEKDKGIRNIETQMMVQSPIIEANCNGELSLRVEPTLVILGCIKVLDAELDVGIVAKADSVLHPDFQICTDVLIAFPVVTIGVCRDDDTKSIMASMGLSAEWEIISVEEASYQIGIHYECLPNKMVQFVEECTYEENKGIEMQEEVGNLCNTYFTQYGQKNQVESTVFCFDYSDNWSIEYEEVRYEDEETTYMDYYGEKVILVNDRGVYIEYTQYTLEPGIIGNGSAYRYQIEYDITKVGDSMLKVLDMSGVENQDDFIVAKIIEENESNTNISYAVLPQSKVGSGRTDIVSFQDKCSFDYPTPYSIIARSPDDQFTKEEENEVIAILSSFRVADVYN